MATLTARKPKTPKAVKRVDRNTSGQKAYFLGDFKEYQSIYGYPKRLVRVMCVPPGGNRQQAFVAGGIKEELVPNEAGEKTLKVYYTKDFHKPAGCLRFYTSPEALMIAFGLQLLHKLKPTESATPEEPKVASKIVPGKRPAPAKNTRKKS